MTEKNRSEQIEVAVAADETFWCNRYRWWTPPNGVEHASLRYFRISMCSLRISAVPIQQHSAISGTLQGTVFSLPRALLPLW